MNNIFFLSEIIIYLSIVVILGLNDVQSQTSQPFPTDSAEWFVVYAELYPFPPYFFYNTDHYITFGDTLINGIEYSKYYGIGSDSILYYQGSYRTLNDSNRVYYIDELDSSEHLVYDYQLVPGDTMQGLREYICVDTGTMVLYNGKHHKYQIMFVPSNDCYQSWVEGIGSLGIPILESYWGCASTFELERNLTCFFYKDEQIYQWFENPYFEGCSGTNVSIEELNKEKTIIIYPNPVSCTSYLLFDEIKPSLFDYEIIDVFGRSWERASNIQANKILIEAREFSNGFYLLQLYSHKLARIISIKFIVNKN